MTRIIAGVARGHTLKVPGSGTRPTSDRVREAIFSRLETLSDVAGARVVDLYAGSGALGLEAASRGAEIVDLVDNSDKAVSVIRTNIAALAAPLRSCLCRAHRAGVASFVNTSRENWDIAFLDPPYDVSNASLSAVLTALAPRLAPDAVVVVERSTRDATPVWPTGFRELDPRDYGDTRVYWLERAE